MAQVDFFAPTPRRHTSRSNLRTAVQATVQFTRPKRAETAAAVTPSVAVHASTSSVKVDTPAEDPIVRPSSRSLKRAFRSPFSKSNPSSPERPAVPELPAELKDNVAALKKEQSVKPSKKSKTKEPEVRMHANSKNYRPVNYNTAVQLNMLLEGGSQEYWLNKARQTGEVDNNTTEQVEEIGGFKDDDGQIWWDMEEKAEWTSLLPKDEQGEAINQNMWVEFTDYRRGSTSSDHSTISSFSVELAEDVDGPLFYGDADPEQTRAAMYGIQKPTTGTVLFPVDMGEDFMSSDAAAARAIIRQANGHLSKKQGVVVSDGFEDHFMSFEEEDKRPRVELSFEQAPVAKPQKKVGILKMLRGNKHATRQ